MRRDETRRPKQKKENNTKTRGDNRNRKPGQAAKQSTAVKFAAQAQAASRRTSRSDDTLTGQGYFAGSEGQLALRHTPPHPTVPYLTLHSPCQHDTTDNGVMGVSLHGVCMRENTSNSNTAEKELGAKNKKETQHTTLRHRAVSPTPQLLKPSPPLSLPAPPRKWDPVQSSPCGLSSCSSCCSATVASASASSSSSSSSSYRSSSS